LEEKVRLGGIGSVIGGCEMAIEIYDPRRGEDFVLKNRRLKKSFSSLHHGLLVVDSQGQSLLSKEVTVLKESIPKTSALGFFIVVLWVPGAKKLKASIQQEFGETFECANSLCGYFDAQSVDNVELLLDLRDTFGGNKSGEWGFGGCLTKFSAPKRISLFRGELWDFEHVLYDADRLGCLLFLGERYTTFVTRIFDGMDAALSQLRWMSKVGL